MPPLTLRVRHPQWSSRRSLAPTACESPKEIESPLPLRHAAGLEGARLGSRTPGSRPRGFYGAPARDTVRARAEARRPVVSANCNCSALRWPGLGLGQGRRGTWDMTGCATASDLPPSVCVLRCGLRCCGVLVGVAQDITFPRSSLWLPGTRPTPRALPTHCETSLTSRGHLTCASGPWTPLQVALPLTRTPRRISLP